MLRVVYFNEGGMVDYEEVVKSLTFDYVNSEQQLVADYNDYVNDRIKVFVHPEKILVNYYDMDNNLISTHVKMSYNIINISIKY